MGVNESDFYDFIFISTMNSTEIQFSEDKINLELYRKQRGTVLQTPVQIPIK